MKRIAIVLFLSACLLLSTGCKGSPATRETVPESLPRESVPSLNMATLISLVDLYGENLTWDTFAPYYYHSVSSQTYNLRRYPIDIDYELKIQGASPDEPPEHIILAAVHDSSVSIDVRTGNIRDFVASGKAPDATKLAKEKVTEIALTHCNTRYDSIEVTYNVDDQEWYVEFWETGATIAAQTVILDKMGHITYDFYAE